MFTNSVLTWHDFTRIIALLSMINGKFIIKISQNKIVKSIFFGPIRNIENYLTNNLTFNIMIKNGKFQDIPAKSGVFSFFILGFKTFKNNNLELL